jgi:hypothetical protein
MNVDIDLGTPINRLPRGLAVPLPRLVGMVNVTVVWQ